MHLAWIKTHGIVLIKCRHVLKMGPNTNRSILINQSQTSHKPIADQS
jgi:hypothetical protein